MGLRLHSRMRLLLRIALLLLVTTLGRAHRFDRSRRLNRCSFPENFVFGASASAFQYEGAVDEGGRKPSIWDAFARTPGKIEDGSSPNTTDDQYHRYKDDVLLLKNMGMDSYRFSISWTRVFPDGQSNVEGIAYYNALIDTLLDHGITPFVTLYHWDLPQALEERFGGWLSQETVKEFVRFADVCFQAFGDRVKHWLTFNEPHQLIKGGFVDGDYAPGRCSSCSKGNSSTEPYIVAHNLLLAHAKAVKVYNQQYKANQKGVIGLTLDSFWYEPFSTRPQDITAAQRALDFEIGWFLHPITFGEYPQSMRFYVGDRLPDFTAEESRDLINSTDFVGLNHYTARYAEDNPMALNSPPGYSSDIRVYSRSDQNGIAIGGETGSWLYVVPWGFYNMLTYIKQNYNNPEIVITENGYLDLDNARSNAATFLNDKARVEYHKLYLSSLQQAIKDGVNVRGYYAWSLLDNWEWQHGFSQRFGLYYVDYTTLKRYPKHSALWFKKFLAKTNCRSDSIEIL